MDIDFGQIPDESFLRDGRYYCRITDADYEQGKYDDWGYKVTLTCVAGEHAGKTMTDRVWASWKGDPTHKLCSRLKIFVKALGLLPDPGAKVTLKPENLIGQYVWIEVKEGDPWVGRDGKERRSYQVDFAGYEGGPPPADFTPPAEEAKPASAPAQQPATAPSKPSPGGEGGGDTPF